MEFDDEYNEPLDLGESNEIIDEEFDDLKNDIDGDEPLDLGNPKEMSKEEFDDLKNDIDGDEPLDLGTTDNEYSENVNDKGETDTPYIEYDTTEDYRKKATDPDSTSDDLHNGFIEHLKKWNK